jgi:2-polyprenyl-3-methyl-5-hydroxy-6-metoxy-1,4-benzoquinol methylase
MDKQKQKEFVKRIFGEVSATMTMGLAYLGVKTGLFAAMHEQGPMTQAQVVAASGLQERYVQEWLGGMTAAGFLEYDPAARTYELPPEYGTYLIPDRPTFLGGLFQMIPGALSVAPRVAECFRTGGGVHFDEYGEEVWEAIELQTAGLYESMLVPQWLTQVPAIDQALTRGGTALDVGCGAGRALTAMAKGYPQAQFKGLDVHAASVAKAQTRAQAEGVAERTSFFTGPLAELPKDERFDVVTAFDVIHDLTEPQETLALMREHLADNGTVLLMEPRVADRLEDNRNPLAVMYYGFSTFH